MRVDKPKKEKRRKPAGWTRLEVDPSSSSSSETLTSSEESDGGGDRDEAKTEKRYHAQLSKQKDPGWKKGSIPIEKYQNYSREPIVFFKSISGDKMIKWSIQIGRVYRREDGRIFVPVVIIGSPLKSRSTLLRYVMNLEMLTLFTKSSKEFEFETIYPLILYLFNNWVKH